MKKRYRTIVLYSFLSGLMLIALNGCNSIRTQDGVTIEKKSSNPLKFW